MKKLSTQNIILGALVLGGGWYFWNKSKKNKELSKEVDITPEETGKEIEKESGGESTSIDTGTGYREAVSPLQSVTSMIKEQTQPGSTLQQVKDLTTTLGIKKPKIKWPKRKKGRSKLFSKRRRSRKLRKGLNTPVSKIPLSIKNTPSMLRNSPALVRPRRKFAGFEEDNVLF